MLKTVDLRLSLDTFENPIFAIHLHCFRLYGYIVAENQRHLWLHQLRCTILTTSIWLCCILMLMRVFQGYERLIDGAISCATAVQYFAVSIATLNAYLQQRRVVRMLRLAHADMLEFLRVADAAELQLLESTKRYVRNIIYVLWVPSVVAGMMAWLDCIYRTIFQPATVFNVAAVRRGEAQPILLFQLFPFGELWDNFLIGYLGPWYALCLGITIIPLWHTFITCLMKYVTFKLRILSKRIKQMDVTLLNPQLNFKTMNDKQLTYWQLKLITHFVKEQLKIRQFVQEIQNLVRVPVMADFIIFSVLMCFLFYALSVGVPSKMDYFFMFLYLFVMASILWLYHWHATLIAECQNMVCFALYDCDWYNYSLPVTKTLLFVMFHAQRPLKMRAILVELNLSSFIEIMRGAYSYFNLMRSHAHV